MNTEGGGEKRSRLIRVGKGRAGCDLGGGTVEGSKDVLDEEEDDGSIFSSETLRRDGGPRNDVAVMLLLVLSAFLCCVDDVAVSIAKISVCSFGETGIGATCGRKVGSMRNPPPLV